MTGMVVMYCSARGSVAQAGVGAKSLPISAEDERTNPMPLNNMAWHKARIKTLRFIYFNLMMKKFGVILYIA